MSLSMHLLSVLIWLPVLGGVALLLMGDHGDAASSTCRHDANDGAGRVAADACY